MSKKWVERENEEHWQDLRDAKFSDRRVKPLTKNQEYYFKAIETSTVTICTGPAGTGKTFIPCGIAAGMLKDHRISKIVLIRPIVSCGQGYGFRPGTTLEKVLPVMRPMLDALEDFFSAREIRKFLDDQTVELWPLDDMRGASIRNSVVILDEAQNAQFNQLHMLLTRFGKGTRVIVAGDATRSQTDLAHHGPNPLLEVIRRFGPDCHPDVSIVQLTRDDIVRHGLIRWIDERLTNEE